MAGQYCIHCMEALTEDICTGCGKTQSEYQSLPHHLTPGTVLNGRYVIGRVLGEGGFGITYIGFDTNLEVKVAVKEYYPNGIVNRNNTFSNDITVTIGSAAATYEKGKAKFHEEAKMLARFSDLTNIVSVKDFFPLHNTEYIVMEYLEGIDLKEYLEKVGKLSFREMYRLIEPIMICLSKVHDKKLIHRDISPSNIMILSNGAVKLLDFGAARTSNVLDEKSLSVMLKPGYAPYEQYSSKGVQGPWTDIYALAATMYRMLAGETPEAATDRVLGDELKSICMLNPTVTKDQESVIFKAMSIMRQDRYASVEEFKNACNSVLNGSSEPSAIFEEKDDQEAETLYTTKYKEDWAATFMGAIERFAGGVKSKIDPPIERVPPQVENVQIAKANKPKNKVAYILCFVIFTLISIKLPLTMNSFSIETELFGDAYYSFDATVVAVLSVLLVITTAISVISYKGTNRFDKKSPKFFLINSIIWFVIVLGAVNEIISSISGAVVELNVETANRMLGVAFMSFYFGVHHLICFFVSKKTHKK